jgi:DNA-binding MarR family transcriptional regulator
MTDHVERFQELRDASSMRREKYRLQEQRLAELLRRDPELTRAVLAARLGVTSDTVDRIAKRAGVKITAKGGWR